MGMPVEVEIVGYKADEKIFDAVFGYFTEVDERFSTYKKDSEISKINSGEIAPEGWSSDMKKIFTLCEETKKDTGGYFDIVSRSGKFDPSGIVKGWAIWNAAEILKNFGFENFFVNAGGDIEARGKNSRGEYWSAGIRNPFDLDKTVKTVVLKNQGIATSGTYLRGQHIYNPFKKDEPIIEILSLTVVGENVYEADRFATPAFAMGREGINFIEKIDGLEGYMIDKDGVATMTSGFEKYVRNGA